MTDDGPDVTRQMRLGDHAEGRATDRSRHTYPRPEDRRWRREPPSMRELRRSVARLRLALAVAALVAALLVLANLPGPW